MPNVINVLGFAFSVYFYTWFQPDMASTVRLGLNPFKVDIIVYFGSVSSILTAICCFCFMWSQRTNALAGNIGMGICSVIVILIHYLLENKWRWGGLLYMLNVMAYAFFMGMAAMGQFSKYYFDRKRVINIAILGIVNMGMSVIILSFMQDTGFSDSLPCFSFGVHTTMAITAQVCGPRTATWNFWKALKKQD